MSEQSYRAAWRELREWLEKHEEEMVNRSNNCSTGIVSALYAGEVSCAGRAKEKITELEKSHVLD